MSEATVKTTTEHSCCILWKIYKQRSAFGKWLLLKTYMHSQTKHKTDYWILATSFPLLLSQEFYPFLFNILIIYFIALSDLGR